MRIRALGCACALASLVACAAQGPREPPPSPAVSLAGDDWQLAFAGYGRANLHGTQGIELRPFISAGEGSTHAALVLSRDELPVGGYELEVEYTLRAQLRAPNPNPWETFWLFFSYRGSSTEEKATNYVMVKTNGIEAGKAWGARGQSFAFTAPKPTLPPGERARLRIKVLPRGQTRLFFRDRYVGEIPGDKLFQQPGRIGLYSEDADVIVHAARLRWLEQ